jgi:hypothetical protein
MTYKITEELANSLMESAGLISTMKKTIDALNIVASRIQFECAINEEAAINKCKDKTESKSKQIPKGYVTIADFCNKSKLIGITSMRRMIGELEISTASKNIKPLYFDPLEFIGLLEDGRLSDYTVIQNRYNALKDISPFLIELRKQINQIN